MLLRALNLGTTVAVIGSGVSRAFGYPTWTEFAWNLVEATARALPGNKKAESLVKRLPKDKAKGLEVNERMFLLGTCKELLQKHAEDAYREYLEEQFAKRKHSADPDPFGPLLDLPIKRFVTTNYDCEIEQALIGRHAIPPADFGLDPKAPGSKESKPGGWRRSFTQRATNPLALFALAGMPGNEHRVFHCHGRFDDPESVVATEEDYQRWYLTKEDRTSFAFQRSIELLLGSNPLLFIGYGLGDEDLLRPLRQLIAVDPQRKSSRQIFALLESSGSGDTSQHDLLLARYGLHAIPYASKGKSQKAKTLALYTALKSLDKRWRDAQEEWLTKPKVKRPLVTTKKPNPHYEIQGTTSLRPQGLVSAGKILRPGLSVVVGPSGSGKSLFANSLLDTAHRGDDSEGVQKYEGAFYWNAHYANEAVTGIDYALSYFDPRRRTRGTRYERIKELLHQHRFLLVIDGCERLLNKSGAAGTGISYSATFHRLLDVFAAPGSRSTVLLVGRLWPADLDGFQEVRRFDARRATSLEICEEEPFKGCAKREVSALCSLLRGHHFGLELASHYLRARPGQKKPDLGELNQRLASRLPDQRLRAIFRFVLKDIDQNLKENLQIEDSQGLAEAFLDRLGLFISPIYAAELAWLYNDAALALSAEGYVVDAYAVWEQAHEICRLIEDPGVGGGFHQEVLLSLTLTFVEMGRLPAAKKYLDDAERLLLKFSDDDTMARILGLRGLMAHLGGNLQEAGDFYDRSLKLLRPGSNLRAQSVFLKYKADVMISVGDLGEADLLIRNSRALAEAGVFPELVANARISEGHLQFRHGKPVEARLEYEAVLSEARRIGTRKLETRALMALARVALDQKDAEGAHTLATQSLSLANELGLGLRQTHSLVILGLTTLALGQRDLGIAYLREAKRLGDTQEYWARSREAENKLLELEAPR